MKRTIVLMMGLVLVTLPGCISRRDAAPAPTDTTQEAVVLDDSNSTVTADAKNAFTLRLPKGLSYQTEAEEPGARLIAVIKKESDKYTRYMYIEETGNSVSAAADLLASVDGVTIVRRETITRDGFDGVKVTAVLKANPGQQVPYYLLSAGGQTYIFSLPSGVPWNLYEQVIDSFTLVSKS